MSVECKYHKIGVKEAKGKHLSDRLATCTNEKYPHDKCPKKYNMAAEECNYYEPIEKDKS